VGHLEDHLELYVGVVDESVVVVVVGSVPRRSRGVLYEVDCVVEGVVVVVVLLLLCLEVVFRIYLRVTQTVSPCAGADAADCF
jgi:hypothetical protein